jgi:pimeloyl-ACP methyl ester carboxylesterase
VGSADSSNNLVWLQTAVGGDEVTYGVAGEGPPVVFLHGWALGHHAYKRSLKRVAALGYQVFVPALPGFGGTLDLPESEFSFAGYAAWVDRFLDSVSITRPAIVIGHSFGGGVAIQLAHDWPERLNRLVLVSSLGAPAWSDAGWGIRSLAERPLWDWGLHFPLTLLPIRRSGRLLATLLEDALPNMVHNPRALWKAANLARQTDLTAELETLAAGDLPVDVLWGERDTIVPRASYEALCKAVGSEGRVVGGQRHLWLLGDPDAFGEALASVLPVLIR